ncbi:hypothetical protein [Haloarcula laminariae]|uniref:hypothetical protein n=1 Tax=Haloarcula laminariae TaxID=2961577 RepID=UPI0024063E17|nr:hypothetical protein [Halomicroarcula sp. FL173]
MQPTDWSPTERGHRVLAFGLVVLLLGSMASVAAANSAFGVRKAEVSATTATVGENITVTGEVVNVGDQGGGFTFEFKRNGTRYGTRWTTFESQRVQGIGPDERRTANATIQFDEPGTYALRVNDRKAGVVTVVASRARVASETDTQRRLDVKASGVSASESVDLDIPPSNRSVALQRWSTTTGQSSFQQYLTEYTNASETPENVSWPAQATLFGVVDFESEDGFESSTMRIGVSDAVIANSALARDEVTVYERDGAAWEPLSTSVAADGANRTVYEATATRDTSYAVGRIDPSISVENTSYGSTVRGNSAQLSVDVRLRNHGAVAGTYRGEMRVNGETVNTTTVTVPANGTADTTISHSVTEPGQYRLAVNGTSVGSVFIPSEQFDDAQQTGTAATGGGPIVGGGDDPLPDAVPATVLGVNTVYLVGGLVIALGAFVVILLLLRGGGDGGGGRPDDFDPW